MLFLFYPISYYPGLVFDYSKTYIYEKDVMLCRGVVLSGLERFVERFNPEETRILSVFFSNTTQPVFYLRNTLEEGEKGALVARYSRSAKSMRRLYLDEFVRDSPKDPFPPELLERVDLLEKLQGLRNKGRERAAKLHKRVIAGFGDDSVLDSSSGTVAIEGVDQLVTKEIENEGLQDT